MSPIKLFILQPVSHRPRALRRASRTRWAMNPAVSMLPVVTASLSVLPCVPEL